MAQSKSARGEIELSRKVLQKCHISAYFRTESTFNTIAMKKHSACRISSSSCCNNCSIHTPPLPNQPSTPPHSLIHKESQRYQLCSYLVRLKIQDRPASPTLEAQTPRCSFPRDLNAQAVEGIVARMESSLVSCCRLFVFKTHKQEKIL